MLTLSVIMFYKTAHVCLLVFNLILVTHASWLDALLVLNISSRNVLRDDTSKVNKTDESLTVPELIVKSGYPVERHKVVTSDEYILQVHRIPGGRNEVLGKTKPAVLLLHGLLSSSADFVISGPEKALGYILADNGFDVWLGNARGNYYSRSHETMSPDSYFSYYWDFSWEEIGRYDLAAMVDYVLKVTHNKGVHFIGYSQGTTAYLVLNALNTNYVPKFLSAHLLGPVAFNENFPNKQLANMAGYSNDMYDMANLMGTVEVFPRNSMFIKKKGEYHCNSENSLAFVCKEVQAAFKVIKNPVIYGHFPSGAALKQIAHYGQNLKARKFQRWDYGEDRNEEYYDSPNPPEYDLSKITTEVVLVHANADILVGEKDVWKLSKVLPNAMVYKVRNASFNHFDFCWRDDAKDLVYKIVIDNIKQMESRITNKY